MADVSVKLVAEDGVGTIAAGVVKALADVVHDLRRTTAGRARRRSAPSSTPACRGSSGLADTQRALCDNDLRDRVRVRVDGGIKTGRDILVRGAARRRRVLLRHGRSCWPRAASWSGPATRTPARPGSRPSAPTCGPSSPARPREWRSTCCSSPRRCGSCWRRSGCGPSTRPSAGWSCCGSGDRRSRGPTRSTCRTCCRPPARARPAAALRRRRADPAAPLGARRPAA